MQNPKLLIIFQILVIISLYNNVVGNDLKNNSDSEGPRIAIVKGKYDRIENILKKYRIPYKQLQYRDIESEHTFKKFSSIFLPCGIGRHVETNLNILSRGTSVQAVFLKDDYLEIDKNIIYDNIKRFIKSGGSAYFSGYSYEFLHNAFNDFVFYDDFPNLGMKGTVNIVLLGDLNIFCRDNILKGYNSHNGWIVAKYIMNSDTLAHGTFETIQGEKNGPLISILKRGKGEAVYTSYHNRRDSEELFRFMVYRIAYRQLLDELSKKTDLWEQKINNKIIDSVREWEIYRLYPIYLFKGWNTLYFKNTKGFFQIDIFDKDENLIISKDVRDNYFLFDIDSNVNDYYIIKIFPSNPAYRDVYSIVTASGIRLFPYYKRAMLIPVFILIIILLFWIKKIFDIRRHKGSIL